MNPVVILESVFAITTKPQFCLLCHFLQHLLERNCCTSLTKECICWYWRIYICTFTVFCGNSLGFFLQVLLYWVTKEMLQTFFANCSDRNVKKKIDIFYSQICRWSQRSWFLAVLLGFSTYALCDDVICINII